MFGFLRPKNPLSDADDAWLLRRLGWLAGRFGESYIKSKALILPTPDYFRDPYDRNLEAAEEVFIRVCRYMDVDPGSIEFEIFDGDRVVKSSMDLFSDRFKQSSSQILGMYRRGRKQKIQIDRELCEDFMGLVSVVSHELSHAKLANETDLDPSCEDNEPLTDLTAIFFGFGVFQARTVARKFGFDEDGLEVPTESVGYLSVDVICHCLATMAWARDEHRPDWMGNLGWYAEKRFKRSMKYLKHIGSGHFRVSRLSAPARGLKDLTAEQLRERLDLALSQEDYETAARIRDLLSDRGDS